MTTTVIIVSPDDTANHLLVYVEDQGAERGEPVVVKPGEQAKPITITATRRIVIEEAARDDRDAPAPKA
jgi:hypothetical protein